jgi:hypothetical protein
MMRLMFGYMLVSILTPEMITFFVVLGVIEDGEENEWFLGIVDNGGEKLDCVESLSLYGICGG